jgi:hypothetical protein
LSFAQQKISVMYISAKFSFLLSRLKKKLAAIAGGEAPFFD